MSYDVIVVDPPWSYYGSTNGWGDAAKFYSLMSDDVVIAYDPSGRLAKNGILFLWATSPRLDFAIEVLHRWGLCYRGVAFVWVKTRLDGVPIGAQGVRPSITKPLCEFVLAGSRVSKGRPMPLSDESIPQTVLAPKREHSQKPEEVQDRIERMYPDAQRLELFARRYRSGWQCEGKDLP